MAGYSPCWFLRPPRQTGGLPSALNGLQPPRCHITRSIHSRNGPTQSESLRFALKKDAHPTDSRQHLKKVILENWAYGSSPAPLWTTQPRNAESYFENRENALSRVRDIRALQSFVEGNVISSSGETTSSPSVQRALREALKNCERHNSYGEILSFLNGLSTRLDRLESKKDYYIHVLGIHYACLAFSESALKYHLHGCLAARDQPLDLEHSQYIVQSLLSFFRASSFHDPKRATDKFLSHVIGNSESESPSLCERLYWARADVRPVQVGGYLSFLVYAKVVKARLELWDRYLEHTVGCSEHDHREYQSAYEYAAALVDVDKLPGALRVLKQVSRRAGNDLPGISTFSRLDVLLKKKAIRESLSKFVSEREHTTILGAEINRIEQRLGIRWDPDRALHTAVSDAGDVTDQPLLSMDATSPGYDSPERLIAEITHLGDSKNPTHLNLIADLLDEYAGHLVPISIPFWSDPDTTFYWAPQRSSVELASLDQDSGRVKKLSDLGLMKVTADKGEGPFALAPSLHLVQLGMLYIQHSLAEQPEFSPEPILGFPLEQPPKIPEMDFWQYPTESLEEHERAPEEPEDKPFEKHEERSDASSDLRETGYLVTWDRAFGRFLIVYIGKGRRAVDPTREFQVLDTDGAPDAIMEVYPLDMAPTNTGPTIGFPSYRVELDPSPDLQQKWFLREGSISRRANDARPDMGLVESG